MLADVRDFASDHPPFQIALPDGNSVVRIRQDEKEKLIERSGLKFSHQVHLVKDGVSSPEGSTVMVCRDCHVLEESGIHFKSMDMQKTCQQSRCHRSYFSKPAKGTIPHGSEREVMNRLRESYARWLIESPANMADCQPTRAAGNPAKRILECADDLAQKNAATLFRETGENLVCGECHEIVPTGNDVVPWKVAPLHIDRDYMPGAEFTHAKHDTIDCTGCHDKATSKTSAEVAMPPIAKCRECHAGDQSVNGKIGSSCNNCHRFHRHMTKADN